MTSVNYPTSYSFQYPNLVATPGPTYTYSFDSMRLAELRSYRSA